MPTAILYIRVSTDEQAAKGYSLKSQEDILRYYCILQGLDIAKIYKEDYSARDFQRPAWKELMLDIRKRNRREKLFLLFTRWDRFSRSTLHAYLMLRTLQGLNIVPQAVEQPLDFSFPENKAIMGIYLAMPEVENDRRSIEIRKAINKAKEEGRWMGEAPMGYKNICSPTGKRFIIPKEPQATFIRYAFEKLATGGTNVIDLYREVVDLGLPCSRTNFYRLLRNPVYAGNILITNSAGRKEIVLGQHTGLVSQQVFDTVQQTFVVHVPTRQYLREYRPDFPLKGFICCPLCMRTLTASSSTGRKGQRYPYYHCISPCGFRIKASEVNDRFFEYVHNMNPADHYLAMFVRDLNDHIKRANGEYIQQQVKDARKIDALTEHLIQAKELLISMAIDLKNYLMIKEDLEGKISVLAQSLCLKQEHSHHLANMEDYCIELFSHPDLLFTRLNNKSRPQFLCWLLRHHWP